MPEIHINVLMNVTPIYSIKSFKIVQIIQMFSKNLSANRNRGHLYNLRSMSHEKLIAKKTVSNFTCRNLGSHHSILTMSKMLSKLKNQQLFLDPSIREPWTQCTLPDPRLTDPDT